MGRAYAAVRLNELKDWLLLEHAYGRNPTPVQVLGKIDQLERRFALGRLCATCGRPACTKTGTPVCCTMCTAGDGHTLMCHRRAGAVAQRAAAGMTRFAEG